MRSNYNAWDIRYEDFYNNESTEGKLAFLVKFAVLAPSSHNSQPWKFVIKGNQISLMPELGRVLGVSDAQGRHLHIALGCAIENLSVAADYYGFKPKITYFPKEEPGTVAGIFFGDKTDKEKDPAHLIFSIPKRRMNRTSYGSRMPEEGLLARFKNFSDENIKIDVITDQICREAIADVLIASRLKAFSSTDFRKELSGYKRTNFTRSFTGMPGFTMGFNDLKSLVAPFAIRHFNIMKLIKNEELDLLKKHTPVFVVMSSKNNTKDDWLATGRLFERMALEAERDGVQVAISAVPPDPESLRQAAGILYRPQLFFRLGYATEIPRHSPRLPVGEVTA